MCGYHGVSRVSAQNGLSMAGMDAYPGLNAYICIQTAFIDFLDIWYMGTYLPWECVLTQNTIVYLSSNFCGKFLCIYYVHLFIYI